jgi:RHS repeat-associated protein
MAVAEIGTSATHSTDSCRVYSYYVGKKASACSESTWPTGSNNNGDVAGYYYNDNVNALSHVATYTYDAVNRLATAVATGGVTYNQTFKYTGDGSNGQYGNMTCTASPAEVNCLAPTYNTSPLNNRIASVENASYSYDSAGDVTGDGTNTYTWDAEAHLTSVVQNGGAISTNTYNALGQRVRDVTTNVTTDEAYGAGGNLLWRYTGSSTDPSQRAFVPFNGSILAEYYGGSPSGTIFDHPDALGSLTIASDYGGNPLNERLYYPFGEFWTGAATPNLLMHQTFAQLPDYDAETDQYNTANRHYTPMGRWMSPDPGGLKAVKLDDPQTWNMYAYVRNNSTTFTDPSGLLLTCTGDQCQRYLAELSKATGMQYSINKEGNITATSKPEDMGTVAKKIDQIISDKKTVAISADSHNAVVGGRFDSNGKQSLNYNSIDRESGKGGFTPESTTIHETVEAYTGLVNGNNFAAAHYVATQYENLVRLNQGLGAHIAEFSSIVTGDNGRTQDFEEHFTLVNQIIDVRLPSLEITNVQVWPTTNPPTLP